MPDDGLLSKLSSTIGQLATSYAHSEVGKALTVGSDVEKTGAADIDYLRKVAKEGMPPIWDTQSATPGPDPEAPWNKHIHHFRQGLNNMAEDLHGFADRNSDKLTPPARAVLHSVATALGFVPIGDTAMETAAMLVPSGGKIEKEELAAKKALDFSKISSHTELTEWPQIEQQKKDAELETLLVKAQGAEARKHATEPLLDFSGISSHKEIKPIPQGGHAGGGAASVEELARPGRFVKISRSGAPTDQGKVPDFTLKAGEAGYQVKPDSTFELKAGQETPATKTAVQKYAKEVFSKKEKFSNKGSDFVSKEFIPPDTEGGLYHVTTALDKVNREGLKSRKETKTIGLGGGLDNQASNKVSATFDENHANMIAERMKLAVQAAKDKISPQQALDRMIQDAQISDDTPYEIANALRAPEETHEDWEIFDKWFSENYKKGDAYSVVQELDDALPQIFTDVDFTTRVGFTASKEEMAKIDPNQIGIVKLEGRAGAKPQHIPDERELRFAPEDIRVIQKPRPQNEQKFKKMSSSGATIGEILASKKTVKKT